jgi:hypothetical protein
LDIEDPLEDSTDVSVENRGILVEGKAEDRAGCVATDAPKCHKLVESVGELTVEVRDDLLGDALEPPGAEVVAEWAPERLYLLQWSFR